MPPPAGSPIPPQLLAALQARGATPPMPGAPPTAMPGSPMANPAAALAQRGQGGVPDQQMMMLLFLAGMGFPTFAGTLDKMKPKPPSTSHKAGAGMAADAARAPQQAIPPQLAAMLAQRAGAAPVSTPAMAAVLPPGMAG